MPLCWWHKGSEQVVASEKLNREKMNVKNLEDVGARLVAQMDFLREVDKLKTVLRRTALMDGSRRENSAEHSWHIALAAMVLAEHSNADVDLLRVIKLLLMHDIVEIDAGDTFAYDLAGKASQAERENLAAARLFGLLPPDQRDEFLGLWAEFEAGETAEAKFATALDRLIPVLQNFANAGGTWLTAGLDRGAVNKRMSPIGDGAAAVSAYVQKLLDEAEALADLAPER
jgi:putative hydrolase of HD superfamily